MWTSSTLEAPAPSVEPPKTPRARASSGSHARERNKSRRKERVVPPPPYAFNLVHIRGSRYVQELTCFQRRCRYGPIARLAGGSRRTSPSPPPLPIIHTYPWRKEYLVREPLPGQRYHVLQHGGRRPKGVENSCVQHSQPDRGPVVPPEGIAEKCQVERVR